MSHAFAKLPLDLLESEAWRSLSLNGRRLVDFLMIEHMRHGAKANGALLAPYNQLVKSGVGRRLIGAAIDETKRLGIVDVRRGYGRSPNRFALTWLPFGDGSEPSNRWKSFAKAPEGEPLRGVHEGEPHRFTKVNHKARSGARR